MNLHKVNKMGSKTKETLIVICASCVRKRLHLQCKRSPNPSTLIILWSSNCQDGTYDSKEINLIINKCWEEQKTKKGPYCSISHTISLSTYNISIRLFSVAGRNRRNTLKRKTPNGYNWGKTTTYIW